jgi:hypothetical protein
MRETTAELYARTGSTRRDFEDYSPGGLTPRAQRRARARKAGLASGRKRRQLARGRRHPHRRTRQDALRLHYPHRQIRRERFEELYWQVRPNGNTRGLETAHRHYVGLFRRYRVSGQHYATTNRERMRALAHAGRPRCRRQVQYLNRLMGQMGLAHVGWKHNQRDTPGHRDHLVVEINSPLRAHKNCTPPTGAGTGPLRGPAVPAFPVIPATENADKPNDKSPRRGRDPCLSRTI